MQDVVDLCICPVGGVSTILSLSLFENMKSIAIMQGNPSSQSRLPSQEMRQTKSPNGKPLPGPPARKPVAHLAGGRGVASREDRVHSLGPALPSWLPESYRRTIESQRAMRWVKPPPVLDEEPLVPRVGLR